MNSVEREFADAIAAAADNQAGKVGVYAFLRQVGDTISATNAPMHEKQTAKGILSAQLNALKVTFVSPEQLNTTVGKLRTQMKILASKGERMTEGEKRDLAALQLAISACEFRIDAGLPDDHGNPTQPVKPAAPKTAPKQQQPLRNGNMRTHSITNAMYARCTQAGLDFNAARPLVETFVKTLHLDETSEMTLARFRNHIERQERLSKSGSDVTHTALAALLKQAAHDVRETEHIGRSAEGMVEGACKETLEAYAAQPVEPEPARAAAHKPEPARIAAREPEASPPAKPIGHMALIRQAAANLAAKNGEPQPTHPAIIPAATAAKPVEAAKPVPAPAAPKPILVEKPAPVAVAPPKPAPLPAAAIEAPPAHSMVEKVARAPRRTAAPVREQKAIPRTFEGACTAMQEWLDNHNMEIEAIKDPKKLKDLSRSDLEQRLQPLQRAIGFSSAKASGQRLYDNVLLLHRIASNPDMDRPGALWGNGGVVSR